jgi:hypothetical protein
MADELRAISAPSVMDHPERICSGSKSNPGYPFVLLKTASIEYQYGSGRSGKQDIKAAPR